MQFQTVGPLSRCVGRERTAQMQRPCRIKSIALAVMLVMTASCILAKKVSGQAGETHAPTLEQQERRDPGLLAWPPSLEGPVATGDWNGARTWLEDRGLALGVRFGPDLKSVSQCLSRGINKPSGERYQACYPKPVPGAYSAGQDPG